MGVPDSSASSASGGCANVTTVAHANPMGTYDAPLIRVTAAGEPDPVTAAIARHVDESGSAYLELPDGRLVLILDVSGGSWITRPGAEIAD
jgi:hypothetical protein